MFLSMSQMGKTFKNKMNRESVKRSQREGEIRSQIQMATGTDLRDNRSATTLPQLHSFTTLLKLLLKRQTFTVHSHVFVRRWNSETTVVYLLFLPCLSSRQFSLAKSSVLFG